MKKLLKALLPYGIVMMHQRARSKNARAAVQESRAEYHAARHLRIAGVESAAPTHPILDGDAYEKVISFLVHRGLPEHHVREGSVPSESLGFIRENVVKNLGSNRPYRALHVGNFVGVSLAFITATLVKRQPESLVISIDPNLTHRGIGNPQSHVLALLSACGLQSNSLIIAGYSGRKSVSNDGTEFEGYDPSKEFQNEYACEETLRNLSSVCPGTFDLVILDGNHDASYLLNELEQITPLLRPGGYVVLDDVDAAWAEIQEVFNRISDFGLEPLQSNGRVGIARARS